MISDKQFSDLSFLVTHDGWKAVVEDIRRRLKLLQNDIESKNFESLAEVTRIQGQIQALKTVLSWPEAAIREYQAKKSKEG